MGFGDVSSLEDPGRSAVGRARCSHSSVGRFVNSGLGDRLVGLVRLQGTPRPCPESDYPAGMRLSSGLAVQISVLGPGLAIAGGALFPLLPADGAAWFAGVTAMLMRRPS